MLQFFVSLKGGSESLFRGQQLWSPWIQQLLAFHFRSPNYISLFIGCEQQTQAASMLVVLEVKGNTSNFTHQRLFTGLGEFYCIYGQSCIKPFEAPERAA